MDHLLAGAGDYLRLARLHGLLRAGLKSDAGALRASLGLADSSALNLAVHCVGHHLGGGVLVGEVGVGGIDSNS